MKSEKRYLTKELQNYISYGGNLDEFISELTDFQREQEEKGFCNIQIDFDAGYNNLSIVTQGQRLETDKEYAARLKKEDLAAQKYKNQKEKKREKIIAQAKKLGMEFKNE